jgi:hypothetical protein
MVEKFLLAIAITFSLNFVHGFAKVESQSKQMPQLQQTRHQLIGFLDEHLHP